MKIKPICEMYNVKYRMHFNPGVVVDVPDELANEYITRGAAVAVDDQGNDIEPAENSDTSPDVEPVEEQPEEQPEEPKKPRGRAKKER